MGLRVYDQAIGYFETAAALMESDFTAASFIVQCHEVERQGGHATGGRQGDETDRKDRVGSGAGRAIGFGVSILVTLGEGKGDGVGDARTPDRP